MCNLQRVALEFTSKCRKLDKNYGCRFEIDILLRLHIWFNAKNSLLKDEIIGIIFSWNDMHRFVIMQNFMYDDIIRVWFNDSSFSISQNTKSRSISNAIN